MKKEHWRVTKTATGLEVSGLTNDELKIVHEALDESLTGEMPSQEKREIFEEEIFLQLAYFIGENGVEKYEGSSYWLKGNVLKVGWRK